MSVLRRNIYRDAEVKPLTVRAAVVGAVVGVLIAVIMLVLSAYLIYRVFFMTKDEQKLSNSSHVGANTPDYRCETRAFSPSLSFMKNEQNLWKRTFALIFSDARISSQKVASVVSVLRVPVDLRLFDPCVNYELVEDPSRLNRAKERRQMLNKIFFTRGESEEVHRNAASSTLDKEGSGRIVKRNMPPPFVVSNQAASDVHNDSFSNNIIYVGAVLVDTNTVSLSESRRFASLAAGVYGCLCSSLIFSFDVFGSDLAKKCSLSQNALSVINMVTYASCFVAFPCGALYDWLGPQPIFALASTLLPIGSLCFALVFADVIQGSLGALISFNILIGIGAMMFDLGSTMTVVRLFPSNRGAVVAVIKTWTALGSAVFGLIRAGFFADRPYEYFLFLMFFTLLTGIVCFFVVRLPPYQLTNYETQHVDNAKRLQRLSSHALYLIQTPPMSRFVVCIILSVVSMLSLPLCTALIKYQILSHGYNFAFLIQSLFLLMLYPLMTVLCISRNGHRIHPHLRLISSMPWVSCSVSPRNEEFNTGERETIIRSGREVKTDFDFIAPQYPTTFLESLRTLRSWALFWTIFAILGCDLVFMSNSRYIVGALSGGHVDDSMSTVLGAINGVGSGVGRLLASGIEMWTQKCRPEERVPITIIFFCSSSLLVVAMVLFMSTPFEVLPLPYVLVAISHGFGAVSIILICSTIFEKDLAKHYGFCYIAVFFSIVFHHFAFFGWYNQEAAKQSSTQCYGKSCVILPLALFLFLNVTALVSSTYLHLDYRRFCAKMLDERRRLKEMVQLELKHPLGTILTSSAPERESIH